MKFTILLLLSNPVLSLLIPGGITTQDTSIPGSLPIWSFVLTTISCTNSSLPETLLVQLAPDTNGVYVHPPAWQSVNAAMIQDSQVSSISQVQMVKMTLAAGRTWQLCGIQISINDAQVYADTTEITISNNSSYTLDLATLQANSLWTQSNQVCNPPSDFSVVDIEQLVVGKIGNYIVSSNNSIDWQNTTSIPLSVSLNGTTQIATLMQYTKSSDVIPFTLYFNTIVSCGGNQITIVISNLYEVYYSTVSDDDQQLISNLLSPLATTTSLSASFCPTITVNSDGSISFGWPFGVGNIGALCWG